MRASRPIAAATLAAALAALVGQTPGSTWTATVPSTPRFAYVANMADGTISAYTVNATTGALRPNGYLLCGGQPSCAVVDPFNKFLAVGTFTPNALFSYTINASSGKLTLASSLAPFASPTDASFSTNGAYLYYPNLDQNYLIQYSVNATTGVLTQTGGNVGTGLWPETIVMHPSLAVAYVPGYLDNDVATYSIGAGGALTEISTRLPIGTGTPGPVSMAVSRDGKYAYVATYDASQLFAYSVNATTGVLTQIGSAITATGMTNPDSLVIDNLSKYVYVSNDGSGNVSAFKIGGTGALTFIANYTAGTNPSRISLDPSNKFVYVCNRTSNTVSIFSINASTGALTAAGTMRTQRQPYAMAIAAGSAAPVYVPKWAYCSNSADNTISRYTINASTGALSPGSNAPTVSSGGTQPLWLEIEPTGRFLYALNRDDSGAQRGLQAFSINQTTGALTAIGARVATDVGPRRFAIEPSGRFLYVAHDGAQSIWSYGINPTTGLLTQLAAPYGNIPMKHAVWGLTIDSTGLTLLVPSFDNGAVDAFAIDLATGNLTLMATSAPQGTTPRPVRSDPSARFVYTGNDKAPEVSAWRLDATPAFTTVGSYGAINNGNASSTIQIDVVPSGAFAYCANWATNNVSRFSVNSTTGALTSLGTTNLGTRPQGVIVDPSGQFLYAANSGSNTISCFTINQTTGALTAISGTVNTGNTPHTVTIFGVLQ